MDCKARGRRCPKEGKDQAAVRAAVAPGRERPWPAGAAGGALIRARPMGPSALRGRGGRGWELGVGIAAGAPWPPRSVARSGARRGVAKPDPSFGVPHPRSLGAARIRRL